MNFSDIFEKVFQILLKIKIYYLNDKLIVLCKV